MTSYAPEPVLDPNRPFMLTQDGVVFFDLPGTSYLSSDDIARSLSNLCRFGGHTPKFYCPSPSTPVLTYDLRWVCAGDIKTGDRLLGFDEHPPGGVRNLRKWRESTATVYGERLDETVRLVMSDGSELVVSSSHPLLVSFKAAGNQRWETAGSILSRFTSGGTTYLPKFLEPWKLDSSYEAGWLAGILDGEGSLSSTASSVSPQLTVAQNPGLVWDQIKLGLSNRGVRFRENRQDEKYTCKNLSVLGGRSVVLGLLGSIRPVRMVSKVSARMVGADFMRHKPLVQVVHAEPCGFGPIVMLETSTRTYLTNGFGSHNSVAEHSVYVSCLLLGHGPLFALAGLVHDGTEAIVQDMVKPLKDLFPDYKAFEDRVAPLVLSTLAPNVPLGEFTNLNLISAVKKADLDLLGWELSSFFGERGFDFAYNGDTSRREISKVSKELGIHEPSCLPPDLAKALFTSTLTRLLSELEC